MSALIAWQWDGEVARPLRRFQKQCDLEFTIGQIYMMEPIDEAQSARDRAYHASMVEVWRNLPERFDGQFPRPDDFRHYCLVKTGFCTLRRIVCPSPKVADELMAEVGHDAFMVHREGAVIVITKPLSQKLSECRGGMSKDERLRSYRETQDFAASLIGVDRQALRQNAGACA